MNIYVRGAMSKKLLVVGIGASITLAGLGLYLAESLINSPNPNRTIQIISIIAILCFGLPLSIIGSCIKEEDN